MIDEQQELLDYVEWLIESNRTATGEADLSKFVPTYFFGTLSEVYEVINADVEKIVGECGDVLAYGVLALYAFGVPPQTISQRLNQRRMVIDVQEALKEFTNAASKYFRGDKEKLEYAALMQDKLFQMVEWAATVSSTRCFLLSVINKQKLEARLANTGTFQGRGER